MKPRQAARATLALGVAVLAGWLGFGLDAFAAGAGRRGVARAALAAAVLAVVGLGAGARALKSRCELEDAEAVIARDTREES